MVIRLTSKKAAHRTPFIIPVPLSCKDNTNTSHSASDSYSLRRISWRKVMNESYGWCYILEHVYVYRVL